MVAGHEWRACALRLLGGTGVSRHAARAEGRRCLTLRRELTRASCERGKRDERRGGQRDDEPVQHGREARVAQREHRAAHRRRDEVVHKVERSRSVAYVLHEPISRGLDGARTHEKDGRPHVVQTSEVLRDDDLSHLPQRREREEECEAHVENDEEEGLVVCNVRRTRHATPACRHVQAEELVECRRVDTMRPVGSIAVVRHPAAQLPRGRRKRRYSVLTPAREAACLDGRQPTGRTAFGHHPIDERHRVAPEHVVARRRLSLVALV